MKTKPIYIILAAATLAAGILATLRGNLWSTACVLILAAATVITYLARLSIDPNGVISSEQMSQNVDVIKEELRKIIRDEFIDEDTRIMKELSGTIKLDGEHAPSSVKEDEEVI